jgi:hypothetical protein
MRFRFQVLSLVFIAFVAVVVAGCQTDDNGQNASARPWNTPKSWEGGFPTGLTEGR